MQHFDIRWFHIITKMMLMIIMMIIIMIIIMIWKFFEGAAWLSLQHRTGPLPPHLFLVDIHLLRAFSKKKVLFRNDWFLLYLFSHWITRDIWKNNDLTSHQEIMMTSQRQVKSLFTNSSLMRKRTVYIKKPVISEKYFILETYLINISISHYSIAQMQTRPPSTGNEMFRFHNFWWKKKQICMIPKGACTDYWCL